MHQSMVKKRRRANKLDWPSVSRAKMGFCMLCSDISSLHSCLVSIQINCKCKISILGRNRTLKASKPENCQDLFVFSFYIRLLFSLQSLYFSLIEYEFDANMIFFVKNGILFLILVLFATVFYMRVFCSFGVVFSFFLV